MRDVTCETEGCENASIAVSIPDNGNEVLCGVCGAQLAAPDSEKQAAWAADHPEE